MSANRTLSSGAWVISGQAISRGLDLISMIILARILTPADFGLVATALTVVVIAETILSLPSASVLVIAQKPTEEMIATAFTLGIMRAGIVAILSVLAGTILAHIYGDDRLFLLTAALSVAPCARGLISPMMALRAINFDFRPQFLVDTVSKLIAFCFSIGVALITESYWAIACGTIAAPIAMVAVSYAVSPYQPKFSLLAWSKFAPYLGWNMLSQLLGAVNWQIDRIFLPKFLTPDQFGRYVISSDISALPIKSIAQPMTGPFMASFSSAWATSADRLRSVYLLSLESIVTVVLPLLALGFLYGNHLSDSVLGAKWQGVGEILSWLCLVGIIALPNVLVALLLSTVGRSDLGPRLIAVDIFIKGAFLVLLLPSYGIHGALISQGVAGIASVVVSCVILHRLVGVSWISQVTALSRPFAALLAMVLFANLLAYCFEYYSIVGRIFETIALTLTLLSYITTVWIAWISSGRPQGLVQTLIARFRPTKHDARTLISESGEGPASNSYRKSE